MAKKTARKIKKVHNKLFKDEMLKRSRFSVANLAVFALIIAGTGTYAVFHGSAASNYYLSSSGSGSICSLTSPCSSVSTASAKLQPGDTLYVRGGTYSFSDYGNWQMPSGTSSAIITIRNYPGETPVFDGNMTAGEFMIPSGKSYWIIQGLTLQHFDNSSGNGVITPSNGSHHLEFRDNIFQNNGSQIDNDHDIYIGGCSSSCRVHDITIHNNRFINGPGGALHMWHYQEGYNISFYDNLVINKRVGAYICDFATNIRIYHNTFVNTSNTAGRGSIVTSCGEQVNGPETLYVRNNIFYRSSGIMWERGGESGTIVEDHNIWFGGTRSWTIDSTDKTSDPQFVDVNNGDYHLQSSSPAINAGTATDAASTDFDYSSRPVGPSYDLGAYEFGGVVSPPQPPPPPPPPPPGSDSTPPSSPTNLVEGTPSSCTNTCTIPVTWTASTDNVGVDHYDEFRNNILVGTDPGNATSTLFGGSLGTCETHTVGLEAVDAAGNRSARTSISATTYCPSTKIADLNSDNAVNIFDLSILLSNYNKTKAQSSNPACDLNNDNIVNIFDLSILLSHYGT